VFTGLVADIGRVSDVSDDDDGVVLRVDTRLAGELASGDSIAVSGVCLTAVAVEPGSFSTEVMNETLERSSLARADVGSEVNLELPLRASDRIGGHVVQGHVDGVGSVESVIEDGFAWRVQIRAPAEVLRYVVHKGSIAVDGVSLTVASIDSGSFTVSLIPETLQRTTLGRVVSGTSVNLEVDVFAKYVEKLVLR
jgi:riboflavin synthase